MNRFDPPAPPPTLIGGSEALSRIAVNKYGPAMLVRGGPAQRAARLVARGASITDAAKTAAAQGKGHVAEIQQSAQFSARSGASMRDLRARPNPRANHPLVDVEVLEGVLPRDGVQMKVGTPEYVARSLRRAGYGNTVINAEAQSVLIERGVIRPGATNDRLSVDSLASDQLTAASSEDLASRLLKAMLGDEALTDEIALMMESLRAGVGEGGISFVVDLVCEVASAWIEGRVFDAAEALATAAKRGAKSVARSAVQARILMGRFLDQARAQFSSRLLHKIARTNIVAGAIAEVVVETAIDLVSVMKNEMTFDEWLRRAGVHVMTAAGGAAGAGAALLLFSKAPWWVAAIAAVAAGYLGAKYGREIGVALFESPRLHLCDGDPCHAPSTESSTL